MTTPIMLSIGIVLLMLARQDFKERTISLWLLIILICLTLLFSLFSQAIEQVVTYALVNLLVWIFQLTTLVLCYKVKQGKRTKVIDTYLGWGDILFLIPVAFLFSPFNFLLFLVLSLSLSLLTVLGSTYFCSNTELLQSIPLAGMQAVILSLLIAYHLLIGVNWYNDILFTY